MRGGDLAIGVLQDIRVGALQDARACSRVALRGAKPCGVFAEFRAAASCFNADHFHSRVPQKCVEQADSIRTAAYTGVEMRGETPLGRREFAHALRGRSLIENRGPSWDMDARQERSPRR